MFGVHMDKPICSVYTVLTIFKRVDLLVEFLYGKSSGKRYGSRSKLKKKSHSEKLLPNSLLLPPPTSLVPHRQVSIYAVRRHLIQRRLICKPLQLSYLNCFQNLKYKKKIH